LRRLIVEGTRVALLSLERLLQSGLVTEDDMKAERHFAALPLAATLLVSAPVLAQPSGARWFPDRPVAWQEHDDTDVRAVPASNSLQEWPATLLIRDSIAGEADRLLGAEGKRPALDVNALDEVPCSTWFCARNHLTPMTVDDVAAGPRFAPPQPPFRIVKGKDEGATTGFQVVDAKGHKFMLKMDPTGLLGLTTAAEMVGQRLFHAAGYNVPGSAMLDIDPRELTVDPKATFRLYGVQKRPLTEERVRTLLDKVARTPEGRLRVVLVPWIDGNILGGFDMVGKRADDPNDRIAHEDRRSLRASWVPFAWLAVMDASSINTIDTFVEENGRHFVRHYIIDFGAALGSFTVRVKGPHESGEYLVEVGRTLAAIASLGFYRRPYQDEREEWSQAVMKFPTLGWFPADDFDPDTYRTALKLPGHVRRTARDEYWGAKVVTSFSDEQIAAVVAQARYPQAEAGYLAHALSARRDVIGRRYLRAVTAVEEPVMSTDNREVCFRDLALERGYARPQEVRYAVEISDGRGHRLRTFQRAAAGARACLPITAEPRGSDYRIVQVVTRFGDWQRPASTSKAARIHLRWRQTEERFVVVGLERDE
jgi:hypothetical protein